MMNSSPRKKAAVISAEGFGDGLLMLIAANFLKVLGYDVTLFNKYLTSMQSQLPSFTISPYFEDQKKYLAFDLVILQNDNSERSKNLILLRANTSLNLYVFYPSFKELKHGPLDKKDVAFIQDISMAENISLSCEKIFPENRCDRKIGIVLPENLTFKKNSKRVAIHPLSGDLQKNWPKEKFLKLYSKLLKYGYDPVFVLSAKEKHFLSERSDINFKAFDSLSDLSLFLYESGFFIGNDSGPGHLASYLQIPSIILADSKRRMKLWQPGWKKAIIIAPPSFIPNIKGLRLRQEKWGLFIPTFLVFKAFKSQPFEGLL